MPSAMRMSAQPQDLLDGVFIMASFLSVHINLAPIVSAVELALVALEADAGYAQANQGEGEQHFPVRHR